MPNFTYRAVVCDTLGPPEHLVLRLLTRPPLPPGHVRVALGAAGLNFPDVLMIEGRYQHKPDLPFVPGLEAAGEIIELGEGVTDRTIGERVAVRMRTGGYAEEAVVPACDCIPAPRGFTDVEAATFLVGHLTAYHALVTRARLSEGETLLVLGAAGGVGLAAVEIGRHIGATVIAVASSEAKRASARVKGAAHVLDPEGEPLAQAVARVTHGRGADVILDPVGQPCETVLRCLAFGGRVLIAGFAGGSIPAYAGNRILLKGASVLGIRAGEAARQDPEMRRRELAAVMALADAGKLRPLVSATFPLASAARAMQMLAGRQAIGRIALTMD